MPAPRLAFRSADKLNRATQKLRVADNNVSLSVPPPSRVGLDMATTLERIQQSFVIADPTLPDCPLIFASDTFIDFTGCVRSLPCRRLRPIPSPPTAGARPSSGDAGLCSRACAAEARPP